MRIGILTFHNTPNFGAVLQTYALCTFIRNIGYEDCRVIDYSCRNIISRELTCKKTGIYLLDMIKRMAWKYTERKILECHRFLYSREIISEEKYDDSNSHTRTA